MKKGLKIRVTGRVQMVMYRDFTRRKAQKLGVAGTVKNLDDGSVEVYALGEEDSLKEFIQYLHRGPTFAKVENVTITELEEPAGCDSFTIIY